MINRMKNEITQMLNKQWFIYDQETQREWEREK